MNSGAITAGRHRGRIALIDILYATEGLSHRTLSFLQEQELWGIYRHAIHSSMPAFEDNLETAMELPVQIELEKLQKIRVQHKGKRIA